MTRYLIIEVFLASALYEVTKEAAQVENNTAKNVYTDRISEFLDIS